MIELNSLSVLQLTLLDATLYHLSTRLILEKDVHAVWDAFPTNTISKYINGCEREAMDSQTSPPVLPVLGRTPPALFLQILHLTWLSRQLPLDDVEHYRQALQCQTELDRIQECYAIVRLEGVSSVRLGVTAKLRNSEISAKLYFLAARVFAAKVLDPNAVTSNSLPTKTWLRQAGTLLDIFDTSEPCGQFICWPLLVLGCAACSITFCEAAQDLPSDDEELHRWQIRGRIHEMLLQIWDISYSGYVKRTLGALERIWNLPLILRRVPATANVSKHSVEYDGLNALTHRDGLGAAFLLADDS